MTYIMLYVKTDMYFIFFSIIFYSNLFRLNWLYLFISNALPNSYNPITRQEITITDKHIIKNLHDSKDEYFIIHNLKKGTR